MLAPGDHVPDFTLLAGFADGRREPTRMHALLERGPVVLSFFPLAFTRVCTTQMCDMRDHHAALDRLGATAYGFSCDSAPANAAFAKAEGLRHGILSDPNREVVDRLWETDPALVVGVARTPRRGWMVVGQDGRVVDLWVAHKAGDAWPGNAPIEAALARLRP